MSGWVYYLEKIQTLQLVKNKTKTFNLQGDALLQSTSNIMSNVNTLRYCLLTSSGDESNDKFKCSNGFSLKQERTLSKKKKQFVKYSY